MTTLKLKIGERDLEFTFGLGFLGEILEETNLGIDEMMEKMDKNPFRMIPLLMYHSARFTLDLRGKKCDFALSDVIGWVEDLGGINSPEVIEFIEAYTKSLLKDVVNEKNMPKEAKKKLTGKKT